MNEHLTDQEIIAFVEADTPDPQTLELLGRVTAHIVRCDPCRQRVSAYQKLSGQQPMTEKNKQKNREKEKLKDF